MKTSRSIAKTDIDETKPRGGSKKTFDSDVEQDLAAMVDEHPTYTLKQLKQELEATGPGIQISLSAYLQLRLLDGRGYTTKQLSLQPVDQNHDDVKSARKECASGLQGDSQLQLLYYVHKTNFIIWCSRRFGRPKIYEGCRHENYTYQRAQYQHPRMHVC